MTSASLGKMFRKFRSVFFFFKNMCPCACVHPVERLQSQAVIAEEKASLAVSVRFISGLLNGVAIKAPSVSVKYSYLGPLCTEAESRLKRKWSHCWTEHLASSLHKIHFYCSSIWCHAIDWIDWTFSPLTSKQKLKLCLWKSDLKADEFLLSLF